MNIKQSFILALKSLSTSKMRSFLTMLGIIIGVAAVILIANLIKGMTDQVLDQFEEMGSTNINVMILGRGDMSSPSSNRNVDIDDMQEIVDKNSTIIKAMTPTITISGAVVKKGIDTTNLTKITGGNQHYAAISNAKAEKGRDLQYIDCSQRLQNCVIGSYVAKEFFGSANALGETIKINGKTFNIVGVLEEKEKSAEGSGDDAIIIPYTVAQKLAESNVIASYIFCAASKDTSDQAQKLIEQYLYDIFKDEYAYQVINMSTLIDIVNDLTTTMSIVGSCVAGISLLVGGIGIMNIMLVSVTERTREIGIRKSLGASPWDIMSQFVVEAITTSCMGGFLGILLGIAGTYIIRSFEIENLTPSIAFNAIFISFTVSAIIGVAFGYFPAKKASRLNPIDALRYD